MPDRLDVVAGRSPDRPSLSICRAASIGELQASAGIDDDDAFDHAGEDRFHARAIARQLGEPASELLHLIVERPRDGAELVVAEVEPRRREVAGAIARGDVGDGAHAVAQAAAEHERDHAGTGQRQTQRRQRRRDAGRSAAERRSAGAPRARRRLRVLDRHGDVQHVRTNRRAISA